MTQEQKDEFVTGGKCVAKRDTYQLKHTENGKWVPDEKDENRLLTKGKQYIIIFKSNRSIRIKDDSGDVSTWTFNFDDTNYTFPFYTKEELRESILNKILK
jgi:hypothetical protein